MTSYVLVTDDHGELHIYTKGPWVSWAQELLHRWGFTLGDPGIDGYFGPYTKAAVLAFQHAQGIPDTGKVDTRTWQALEAAKIVFDTYPVTSGNNLEWTVRNDGFGPRPAGKSAGRFSVYERGGKQATVGPEEPFRLAADLDPGKTFTASTDLLRLSPLDGEFTAWVQLKYDAAAVDYDVASGAVAAPGTFAQAAPAQGQSVPSLRFHSQPRRSGSKVVWEVRNAGLGDLWAGSPVADVEVLDGMMLAFTAPPVVAPNDIYSLQIQQFEVDLAGAPLPVGLLTALVTLPGMVIGNFDFWFDGAVFSDP
jgi:hypothetical protein